MNFRIVWDVPEGQFGWLNITDAIDMSDAVDAFQDARRLETIPVNAVIQQISEVK